MESEVAYAGLVTRAIAIVIDAVVINVVAIAVTGAVLLVESLFSVTSRHSTLMKTLGVVLFGLWVVCYFCVFWTTTGQTPGSRVMAIRVTRTDGAHLRPYRALIRLGGMVASLPLFWGYLPILWTPRRRGAYDLVAGSVVTVVPPQIGVDPRLAADHRLAGRSDPLVAGVTGSRERDGATDDGPVTRGGLNLDRAADRDETLS